MVDNKNSYTYRKYISNKTIAKLFRVFILADIFIGIYFLIKFYLSTGKLYPVTATLIVLVVLVIFYREASIADKEMREIEFRNYFTWGGGAGAELIVKRSLMALSDDYRIISDFQMDRGNIDHICIGPTGMFAIEVKAHKGVISYIDGKLKRNNQDIGSFLGQAKRGSVYLNHLIKEKIGKEYFVVPVLVFPSAKMDNSINHQIEGVWVGGKGFERWVAENCKNMLTLEEIEIICQSLSE